MSGLSELSVEDARLIYSDMLILEKGEGPRWKFRYSNFNVDPSPDILLLGAYRHPNTGNNLVGGINLHYLNKQQLDKLANILPKVMNARNLYYRYHVGKRLAPEIFKNYYRTYNSAHIQGVQQDTMYPKYGLLKTAKDWLKKKITGLYKSKDQRQKDAEPQYPNDLSNMRDRLNQVVTSIQQQPRQEIPQDTEEVNAAQTEYQRLQAQRQKDVNDIEADENAPLIRSADSYGKTLEKELDKIPIKQPGVQSIPEPDQIDGDTTSPDLDTQAGKEQLSSQIEADIENNEKE
ncbi:MAG: hypothetical protein ACKOQ2_24485, partial [Dolichospermum sp.]